MLNETLKKTDMQKVAREKQSQIAGWTSKIRCSAFVYSTKKQHRETMINKNNGV